MYYYIKGKLAVKGENFIVADVNGVGYKIYTSLNDIEKSGSIGTEITMYTYLNVREDAMELYGFITEEEKNMFLMLISVSGVGPKAGLAVLSVTTPAKLAAAIMTGDAKTITRAQGVGSKVAQRIILDLKDKIHAEDIGIDGDEGVIAAEDTVLIDSRAEAMSALAALGYSAQEAKNVVSKLDASLSTEELIKKALAQLM